MDTNSQYATGDPYIDKALARNIPGKTGSNLTLTDSQEAVVEASVSSVETGTFNIVQEVDSETQVPEDEGNSLLLVKLINNPSHFAEQIFEEIQLGVVTFNKFQPFLKEVSPETQITFCASLLSKATTADNLLNSTKLVIYHFQRFTEDLIKEKGLNIMGSETLSLIVEGNLIDPVIVAEVKHLLYHRGLLQITGTWGLTFKNDISPELLTIIRSWGES